MLTLINASGGVPLRCDDYYIKQLASGLDELIFTISIWDENYAAIQEESNIREQSGSPANYLVKAIDGGTATATIKCQIDLDEWRSTLNVNYNSGSHTVGEIVLAVKPTGWSVTDNSGISYKRTIELEAATPMDVLEQCRSTFNGITFRFDNINKVVEIINMSSGTNLGAFVTRDLNLTANDYKGKSTSFATRLYAYGKDGLSFASINGGKPYVENHTYSNRVICAYWSDERYTVAANLLADAQAKIDALAVPQRSFDLSVVDLAAVNPAKYSELSFTLFSIVSLIDQTRSGSKIDHTVVERWIYPYHPEKNKVTLSTAAPRIQSQINQVINAVTNVNSEWKQQQTAFFEVLTAAILGASGGAVRLIDTNDDGMPDTLYIADNAEPALATKVWRFNYEGWGASTNGYNGPFSLGATFTDGGTFYANVLKILNIDASNISTGTLSANRIAANSIAVEKLTGTISGGLQNTWELDLTNGTFTIGNMSADNITAGTINADSINVTNINGANIKNGTIGSNPLAASAVTETKLGTGAVTNTKLGNLSVSNGKIDSGAVSYGKTDFTGTLDQVGTNKSNIEAIQSAFLGTLGVNIVNVTQSLRIQTGASFSIGGYTPTMLAAASAVHVLGTTY